MLSIALLRRSVPVVLLGFVSLTFAGDWPTFRGADRTGVSQETGLLQEWPAGGPPVVWKAEGAGRGYADPTVAGKYVFTLGDAPKGVADKDEYLVCLDRETGKALWHTRTGSPWTSGAPDWQSSRGTPSTDGELVYVVTPHGVLLCCDAATGQEKWRKDFKKDFGGKKADGWGYSESPLIDGDLLICTPGGSETTLCALDKKTGELKWKTVQDGNVGAGHSSAVISEVAGTKVYVQLTGSGPIGVRASDGQLLWSYKMDRTTAVCPTPIIKGDLVFFAAGYRRGGALLKQVPGSEGQINVEEIYPINPELANKHGGVVLVGDYLYGDSDDKGIPFCAELMTGKKVWKDKRGSGRGSASFASADGRLYIHYASGQMVLAKADPAEYVEVGSFRAPGAGDRPGWSHPVVVDGRLYVREQDTITCFDVKAK